MDEQELEEHLRRLEAEREAKRIKKERAELARSEAQRKAKEQLELAALERERQAEKYAARLQGAKQAMLIERAQRDPCGFQFDGKYRDLDEVSDAEAVAWLKKREQERG